ncbi:MAG: hypothetical protein KDH97_00405 [Calditrichaeota bacterium]|nr:hypothetical protein [Calditrichota bacterium]MCB9088424.1 hypothetical protein [Calditrichia bacterium]MCB0288695.1 hypothetical protein [Calditrichota bacterium]MCB0294341.1 hypothetical protein [Calditrichota bacterium]MCB0302628.1 hypothetical protein [Calditrichota bacterium]
MDVRELIRSLEGNSRQYQQVLQHVPRTPGPALSGIENAQLREIIGVLTDIQEEVIEYRLKKILKEEHPYIPTIKVEKIKQNDHHQHLPLSQLVDVFLAQRRALLQLLQATPTATWSRTGVHESEGHISFQEIIRRMTEKDRQVLANLNRLLLQIEST